MGRRPLNIDPTRVTELAANGMIQREIAAILDCSEDTLQKRFAAEYKKGQEVCNSRLRSKQVERALAGSDTMLIWLGKNRLGQTDRQDVTSGGEPLRVVNEYIGSSLPLATEASKAPRVN